MDLEDVYDDRRTRGILLVVSGGLLLIASLLLAYNSVPFCTPNYTTEGTMVTSDAALQRFQDRNGELERSLISDPTAPTARYTGTVYAYHNSTADRFWIVHTGTPRGDELYGPFDGSPRTCTFYPEKR